jgi:predicted transcriptional regulator
MSEAKTDTPEPDSNEAERELTVAAVKESMAAFERGEGRPAREVLEQLRKKYHIPRDI